MRMIFDFRCANDHVTEHLVQNTVTAVKCSTCDEQAVRMISPVKCVLNNSFPGYASKWEREHEHHGDLAKARRGEELG